MSGNGWHQHVKNTLQARFVAGFSLFASGTGWHYKASASKYFSWYSTGYRRYAFRIFWRYHLLMTLKIMVSDQQKSKRSAGFQDVN
jgi:hypothetical protein